MADVAVVDVASLADDADVVLAVPAARLAITLSADVVPSIMSSNDEPVLLDAVPNALSVPSTVLVEVLVPSRLASDDEADEADDADVDDVPPPSTRLSTLANWVLVSAAVDVLSVVLVPPAAVAALLLL